MADTKISALPSATTPLAGTEVLPIVQSGVTDQVSVSNLTAGRTVTVGRISATTSVGTPSSNAQYGYGATQGAVITGTGTTYDVQLQNKTNQNVLSIPTGTRDANLAAGNLVIGTSGKGIDFSATSHAAGMTSELLNDYEEGTWTPVLTDLTNNATMGATTYGRYTKIGRQVFLQGAVEVSSLGSVSGNIYISGVPFTLPGLAVTNGVGRAGALSIPANSSVGLYAHSSNVISLWLWDATTGTTFMQASEFTASGYIFFSFSFIV